MDDLHNVETLDMSHNKLSYVITGTMDGMMVDLRHNPLDITTITVFRTLHLQYWSTDNALLLCGN